MNALTFLIDVAFNTYLMIVILRVWLQLAKADFYNPLSQFIVKATNPILVPLRRIIPGVFGIDMAGVALAFIIAIGKFAVLSLVQGEALNWVVLPILGILMAIKKAGVLLFWILLIRAILSWVSQGGHPVEYVMAQLTEPLLAPVRRILPAMGGLDLSMLVVFIGLNFINILIGDLLTPVIGPIWFSL
ncbi:YggT family protein [Psychrobium sp. 1_MG-2023]|uniref:YggT family protein n=1 Tax=Psychrobium sp. 1_MG-2023 TaxID=3062624 RepID=UPI000C33D9CE|nr:YggT family protein [Psychrobium sp. 1_MG-2023]MDP2562370.1 YggT family protein [Psychrobium sp. 1_MG-2023]PKF55864.1 hypothetical protein CW748_12080 [Alteromonadales bacterium alter-6D02]